MFFLIRNMLYRYRFLFPFLQPIRKGMVCLFIQITKYQKIQSVKELNFLYFCHSIFFRIVPQSPVYNACIGGRLGPDEGSEPSLQCRLPGGGGQDSGPGQQGSRAQAKYVEASHPLKHQFWSAGMADSCHFMCIQIFILMLLNP